MCVTSASVALSKCLEVCILCYLTHSFETKYSGTRSSISLVSGVGSLDVFQHGNDLTTGVLVARLLWTNHRKGRKLQDGQAHFCSFYKN